jgi:hypothetical protein
LSKEVDFRLTSKVVNFSGKLKWVGVTFQRELLHGLRYWRGTSGFDSGVSIKITTRGLFIYPGDGMERAGLLETSLYMTRRGHVLEEGYLLLVINTVRKSFW